MTPANTKPAPPVGRLSLEDRNSVAIYTPGSRLKRPSRRTLHDMGVLFAVRTALFAAKVTNCLADLKVNVRRLDSVSAHALREIEKTKRGDFSPHEAALCWFVFAIPTLHESCFTVPMDRTELAGRAEILSSLWLRQGKVRASVVNTLFKGLHKPKASC